MKLHQLWLHFTAVCVFACARDHVGMVTVVVVLVHDHHVMLLGGACHMGRKGAHAAHVRRHRRVGRRATLLLLLLP